MVRCYFYFNWLTMAFKIGLQKQKTKKNNEMQHIQFMHYLALTVILVVIWNIIPM